MARFPHPRQPVAAQVEPREEGKAAEHLDLAPGIDKIVLQVQCLELGHLALDLVAVQGGDPVAGEVQLPELRKEGSDANCRPPVDGGPVHHQRSQVGEEGPAWLRISNIED